MYGHHSVIHWEHSPALVPFFFTEDGTTVMHLRQGEKYGSLNKQNLLAKSVFPFSVLFLGEALYLILADDRVTPYHR